MHSDTHRQTSDRQTDDIIMPIADQFREVRSAKTADVLATVTDE